MCGRIVQKHTEEKLNEIVDPKRVVAKFDPRYNIAPSQEVPLVRLSRDGQRELVAVKWGLVPHWATSAKTIKTQINARSEGIELKPYFRDAFRKHRCLVPVSGFYEWKKQGSKKQPYYIHSTDDKPFFLAGLWDEVKNEQQQTFAIVTTQADKLISAIHNRMPFIITKNDFDIWLSGNVNDAKSLLKCSTNAELEVYAVSTFVNSSANDSEECIRRVGGIC